MLVAEMNQVEMFSMNHMQRMWIKAYQDYLDAVKSQGKPMHSTDVFMARKHADAVIQSLRELENA